MRRPPPVPGRRVHESITTQVVEALRMRRRGAGVAPSEGPGEQRDELPSLRRACRAPAAHALFPGTISLPGRVRSYCPISCSSRAPCVPTDVQLLALPRASRSVPPGWSRRPSLRPGAVLHRPGPGVRRPRLERVHLPSHAQDGRRVQTPRASLTHADAIPASLTANIGQPPVGQFVTLHASDIQVSTASASPAGDAHRPRNPLHPGALPRNRWTRAPGKQGEGMAVSDSGIRRRRGMPGCEYRPR